MPELTPLPADYASWLADLKSRIHTAQQRATLAVNRELVLLYWQIGKDILTRQSNEGWGAKVIAPAGAGFTQCLPENERLFAAQPQVHAAFAETWPDAEFVQAVLAQLLELGNPRKKMLPDLTIQTVPC